eukprot:Nk52_evm1s2102 gene=Nk52_evmTU1s2102
MSVNDRWHYFQEWILPYLKSEAQQRQLYMKQAYDKRIKKRNFQICEGQIVYVKNESRKQKFDRLYLGPYIVKTLNADGTLQLESGTTGKILQRRVSPEQVKVIKVSNVAE